MGLCQGRGMESSGKVLGKFWETSGKALGLCWHEWVSLVLLGPLSSELFSSSLRGKDVCRAGRCWPCSLFAAGALCLAPLRDSCEGSYLMSHLMTAAWPEKTALCPHRLPHRKRLFRLIFHLEV